MAGRLVEFAGWLATQVFDVVGSVAGVQGADGGATVDLQVGKTVHVVPAQMRTELWLSQLHRKTAGGGTPSVGEYYDLLFEELSPEVLAEIDKDTHRTFPGHTWLSSPAGQKAMLNVLRAYALSDPEIGYTQGMNFLAGLLLTYLPSEAEAYAALSLLMRQRGLRELYLPDMSLLQIRLWQLSRLLPPRLSSHLEAHAALPVLYASSWLLTCFAADFPLHFAARVVDVLMTGQAAASPMLKVAVGLVSACEADLLRMGDFEEMVNYLRQEVPRWPKAALHDLLTDALSKPWTPRQLRVLDQINGAETVMEAVARVNRLAAHSTSESAEVTAAPAADASSPSPGPQPSPSSALRQQSGDAQLTPRSVAQTLSTSVRLPKPPRGPSGDKAAAWAALGAAPDLQSLPTQRVAIERTIGETVQLDPRLSQALSAYSPYRLSPETSGAPQRSPDGSMPRPPERAPQQGAAQQQHRQRAEAGEPAEPPSPEVTAGKWDAFAHQSTAHLKAAPSPFDACPSGHGTLEPSGPHPAPPVPPQRQQQLPAALAAAAGTQGVDQAASAAGLSAAPSWHPSFDGASHTADPRVDAPLVDLTEQQGPRSVQSSDGGANGTLTSFLSLFTKAADASTQGGQGGGPVSSGSPSPHAAAGEGGKLAAAMHSLHLESEGGGAPSGLGDRQLRHSSELEEWSSFKTAAASEPCSEAAPHATEAGLGSTGSWRGGLDRLPRQASGAGSQGSAALGLKTLWSPGVDVTRAGSSKARTPMRPTSPLPAGAEGQPSARLSTDAATRRAASLQEEHIQEFFASGGKQ